MDLLQYFFTPSKRFYIGYLISAGIIAILFFLIKRKKLTLSNAKAYWFHPSALLDYSYFALAGFVKIYLIVPLIISAQTITLWVREICMSYFGYVSFPYVSGATVTLLYTFILFVVSDFSRYWLHRAMHEIPFLWSFHKVHHSAEVLNPTTFYRVHPVENLLFGLRYSIIIGAVTGVFIYLFGAKVDRYDILGANALLFTFNIIGGNLRHSHIELYYPAFLEKLFISPRQHQLHHSYHFTRYNYGGYLAIWDTIFKTVITSSEARYQPTSYGLGTKENDKYRNLTGLFFRPFNDVYKKWQKQNKTKTISKSLR